MRLRALRWDGIAGGALQASHLLLLPLLLACCSVLAWAMLMADMELNPLPQETNLLSMNDTSVETNAFLIKFVMAAA